MFTAFGSALPAIIRWKDDPRLRFTKLFNVPKYSHVILPGDADHKPIPAKVYQQDRQIRTVTKPRALVKSKCFQDYSIHFSAAASALN